MTAVSPERIALVREHVADALVRTSPNSALPEAEQDRLLAQACAETCDLLTDWLSSEDWARLRTRSLGRVGDAFPDATAFLGQPLADLLTRSGAEAAGPLVTCAHEAVRGTARRFPQWRQAELFTEANARIAELRREACQLADVLRSAARPAARGRARGLLVRAVAVIPTLVLAMAATSPAQMGQNLATWEHDAARVVSTYLVAQQAHPETVIAPPQLRPPEISGPSL